MSIKISWNYPYIFVYGFLDVFYSIYEVLKYLHFQNWKKMLWNDRDAHYNSLLVTKVVMLHLCWNSFLWGKRIKLLASVIQLCDGWHRIHTHKKHARSKIIILQLIILRILWTLCLLLLRLKNIRKLCIQVHEHVRATISFIDGS